ncbi:MAG: CRISPR-associated endonuclease Cas1 [Sulfuritalea sp.]|nr:CRISPR-associated endonuclease Cas1 [Sulfuritalea sp.]
MTSLYVDRRGVHLKADGEALVFYENNARCGTVPLAPLSRVFLRGDVTLNASLLGKLGERGIGVVVLSGRKGEPTMLMGRPHNDAARRVAQYRLSLDADFCLRFARAIVEAKLAAQRALIAERRDEDLRWRYPLTVCLERLDGCMATVDAQPNIAALRGLEGAGAAAYFQGYRELFAEHLHFSGRNRRPPQDPVNAVLSLSYTLLHAEAVIALYGAGMDPFIGFYHALDFGRESLACDVVEALRPEADRFVLKLFRTETLRHEDFSQTDGACLLGKAGRGRYYAEWESAAEGLRRALTEAIADVATAVDDYHPATTDAADTAEEEFD